MSTRAAHGCLLLMLGLFVTAPLMAAARSAHHPVSPIPSATTTAATPAGQEAMGEEGVPPRSSFPLGRFLSYGVIFQVVALIHFGRRRPDNYWLWIIIMFGAPGAIAYFIVEMIPDMRMARSSVSGFSRRKRVRYLEAIILENPSAGNYEQLGDLLLEEKHYARAKECFDHAISSRTDSLDPFYRRGICAFQLENHEAALVDLERVVKADARYDYYSALRFYAQALVKVGRVNEAAETFARLQAGSTATESLYACAEFHASHDRQDEARALLDQIMARRVTMPSFQRRRDRPWLRKAAALRRKLSQAQGKSLATRAA